ncbi:MAG: gamma-glutamyl-gamma-aminobutyrate hydrolase family protein [Armatimonadetes bacterium]|nr:gamma-glutamyl-gamma-aminobutyrate hydrolase family protein [Armatimonadota bacterium]
MKPVIGITAAHELEKGPNNDGDGRVFTNRLYCECIAAAGAVPIIIPHQAAIEDVIPLIDGLLIPGGDDIDAAHFGEANHSKVNLAEPARYPFEASLLKSMPEEAPILGICYGAQAVNIFFGGNLVQHIPDVTGNDSHSAGTVQSYRIEPDSRLCDIVGKSTAEGKTYHHQSNDRPGDGLRAVAWSDDGVVEAIEGLQRWILGVQWHPERTPESEDTQRIFSEFARQARQYGASRRA